MWTDESDASVAWFKRGVELTREWAVSCDLNQNKPDLGNALARGKAVRDTPEDTQKIRTSNLTSYDTETLKKPGSRYGNSFVSYYEVKGGIGFGTQLVIRAIGRNCTEGTLKHSEYVSLR